MDLINIERKKDEILYKMSESIRALVKNIDFKDIEEIRIRKNLPLAVYCGQTVKYISKNSVSSSNPNNAYIVTQNDIERTLELLCANSIYSFQEQIREGYISIEGGHRVGVAGRAVIKNGEIVGIKDVSGLNFRFSRQIKGVSESIIGEIICENKVSNTLIISAPGKGKTTMLRDIAYTISNRGIKTVIIDERGEIAAMTGGKCGYDVGVHTDVLDMCPKASGIMMAVRSLSPQVMICDEIGGKNDIEAIKTASRCGVSVIASAHADNAVDFFEKGFNDETLEIFDVFITLERREENGSIQSVFRNKELKELLKNGAIK